MGTKITVLPPVITPTGTDELPISQDTGYGGRITYKATLDQIKNYVKNTGNGTGSVTNIGVNSPDSSIGVFGSPVTSSGTISLTIDSVGLDKLDDGGATGGEVLTYNGSTNEWEPGFGNSSGITPNILVGNGNTIYTLTNYTDDTASNYLVFVGGVAQRPTTDFTISGSSIIFGSTIATGVQILVYSVINLGSISIDIDATPIGTVTWFAASAAPLSYLECDGRVISKSEYGELYTIIKDTYTTVLSANHFRLPDLRGEFIRGWDDGRGVDTDRVFGSWQKGTLMGYDQGNDAIWHTSTITAYGSASQPVIGVDDYNISDYSGVRLKGENAGGGIDLKGSNTIDEGYTGTTRPRNVALLPCIKAQKTVTGDPSTLNFIEKPASPIDDGAFLRYDSVTNTWAAKGGYTSLLTTSEPALGLPLRSWSHYNGCFYSKNQLYIFGYSPATFSIDSYASRPTRIPFDENYLMKNPSLTITKVIDSPLNTFVLLSDGTFWGAGNCINWQNIYTTATNYTFQLIKLNSMFANKPVRDFSMATANDNETTVGIICTDGTVYAWGYNGFGQIGNGVNTNSTSPVLINVAGKTISQISVGGWSNSGGNILLRMSDGTLYAAGYNVHGQLGNNTTTSTLDQPTGKTFTQCLEGPTTPITNVAQICETGSMNQIYTRYVIKTDGTVWATGLNNAGQLGITSLAIGTNSSYFRKVDLPNGTVATKVVNSGWSTLTTVAALDSNGNVYAWGYTAHGQTGAGTATAFNTPTKVTVYQKNLNDTAPLPSIKDIFGAPSSNAGAIGLISVDKQLFTAGVYTYAPITLMKTQTRHTDSYYRFELANVENVEEGMFYCNNSTGAGNDGHTVGTIVRDSGGIIWAWGINAGGIIHPVEYKNVAKPTRINY
jgi:hypothetical protein